MVSVPTAENPVTPSKVAAVVAAEAVLVPDPPQSPEIVKVFDNPFAINVVYALLTGKDEVEVTGPDEELPPPPPPQAARVNDTAIKVTADRILFMVYLLPG